MCEEVHFSKFRGLQACSWQLYYQVNSFIICILHIYNIYIIYIYIYIYIYVYTEGFVEVRSSYAIERWPEWDLNPRPLNSV